MKGLDETPMACSLTAVELRDREATLLAQLRSAVVETEELQDGYAFRLSADSKSIRLIAELVVAERECGRFMTFEMAALPNLGPVIVRVIVACKCEGVLEHYPSVVFHNWLHIIGFRQRLAGPLDFSKNFFALFLPDIGFGIEIPLL